MLLYWGLVGKYLVRGVIRNGNGRIDIPEVTVVFSLQGPCMKQLMEQALARGALSWLFSVVSFSVWCLSCFVKKKDGSRGSR